MMGRQDRVRVCLSATALGFAMLSIPADVGAQRLVYGDTIVEILGLRQWTPKEVEDGVRRYAPTLTLASAACAVILRDSLGFADAAVMTASFAGQDTVRTTIIVIEPADSGLVRYTTSRRTDMAMPRSWMRLDSALARQPRLLSYFQHSEFLLDGADSIFGQPIPVEARDLLAALRTFNTAEDRAIAHDILLHGSASRARALAALVASNFPDDPASWYALVEAFRAGSDWGASTATMVVSALARSNRYVIDWRPAQEALEAVLGGTHLFAYGELLDALVDTQIEPGFARALSRINPHLLADHAAAQNGIVRVPAHRFLVHAGSPDFGRDREAWLRWLTQ